MDPRNLPGGGVSIMVTQGPDPNHGPALQAIPLCDAGLLTMKGASGLKGSIPRRKLLRVLLPTPRGPSSIILG